MKNFIEFISLLCLFAVVSCTDSGVATKDKEETPRSSGPKIEVSASVDKPQVDIGARVKYRVEVKFQEGVEVDWPPIFEQLDGQIVYDIGIWTEEDPVGVYRIRSMTVVLDPGIDEVLSIAPTVIRWRESADQVWEEIATDAITVEVVSVSEGAPELQEPLDTFEMPLAKEQTEKKDGKTALMIIGIAVALLSAAAFFMFRKRRQKPVPTLSPEEIATQELDHLESLDLLSQKRVKEFYYRLTAIIRRYIELRFGIMASEQTTEEFLASMKNDDRLTADEKEILQGFLSTADLVRYALHEPPVAEVQASMVMARGFVDRTPAAEEKEEVSHAL